MTGSPQPAPQPAPQRLGLSETEMAHLRRCVELAEEALNAGDEPFGSVLVGGDGVVLAEDRNRIAGGDRTRHPEFELARWAAENMAEEDRADATVFTSGEHCPMCAAAHAWVGLGRIVYASSAAQLASWLEELGAAPTPVRPLPINEVAPGVVAVGPVPELVASVRALQVRRHSPTLPKIGAPATRALAAIGVTTLDGVAQHSAAELAALHGVGPKAIRILADELASRGMGFRS